MNISVSEEIFSRLQSACEQKSKALPDLAAEAGIALSSIYRWRSGSKPRRKNIDELASRLGINANWLETGEGQMNSIKRESFSNARILGPVDEIFAGTVPVVSWAHAGSATSYEELPAHWQERIPTLCRGKRAFGLIVEGDSMEPKCEPNDVVIVDPDEELRNGCLVVAKLKNDGVVLRRFTRLESERIKLIPYNQIYPSVEYSLKEFHWIYPVHSSFRRELL